MLVSTASSCGVRASGISDTAPTVPCSVSRRVRPVNTRFVMSCSVLGEGLPAWQVVGERNLLRQPEVPVRRSQTSKSFSSSRRFQLIAETRSMSFRGLRGIEIGAMSSVPFTRCRYRRWTCFRTPPARSAGAVPYKSLVTLWFLRVVGLPSVRFAASSPQGGEPRKGARYMNGHLWLFDACGL